MHFFNRLTSPAHCSLLYSSKLHGLLFFQRPHSLPNSCSLPSTTPVEFFPQSNLGTTTSGPPTLFPLTLCYLVYGFLVRLPDHQTYSDHLRVARRNKSLSVLPQSPGAVLYGTRTPPRPDCAQFVWCPSQVVGGGGICQDQGPADHQILLLQFCSRHCCQGLPRSSDFSRTIRLETQQAGVPLSGTPLLLPLHVTV